EEYQTEYDDMYCTGGGDPAASYEAFGHYTEDGEWVEDEECVDESAYEEEYVSEDQNFVEITPEEQAAVDAECSTDDLAEAERLASGETVAPVAPDDPYADAQKLKLEEEKQKKEDAAGKPSKEPSDPKNTASGEHKTSTENDTGKHDASVKGGLHQSGGSVGGDVKSEEKTETGTSHMKGGAELKVNDKGGEGSVSIGGGSHQVDNADAEKRKKKEADELIEFEQKKARGEIDKDAKFEPSEDAKEKTAPGSSTTVKTGGGYNKDTGGYGQLDVNNERTNPDGTKTNIGGNAKFGHGPDGYNGGGGLNISHTDKNGKNIGGGASFEADSKGVNAKANADYKGVGGGIEVISKDGEDGMRGDVKAGTDTVSVSVKGGKVAKFSPVNKLPNGGYAVTYTVTSEVGGGVRANTDPKSKGAQVGGSFNASSTDQIATTKVFASEAEALAFRSAENAGEPSFPTSANQASALKPGEKVVMGEGFNMGIDASAGTSSLGSVGVGHSTGSSERTSVEMLEGNAVFAERTATMDSTGKLSYTAPGGLAGISGSNTDTKTVRTKIKVELGTDAAPNEAGRAAYARFMEDGSVIPPAQTISTTTSTGETKGREINLGPVKGFEIQKVEDGVTYDEEGKLEHTSGERSRGWEIKSLGMGGSYSTKLEALQRNDDDEKRAYVATSTVKQTDAYDSLRRLNDVAGGGIRGEEELKGLKASGTWEVQSVLAPEAVDQFVTEVQKGNYNPNLVTTKSGKVEGSTRNYFSAGDNLQEALKEAGDDKDKQRLALAKFVAEGGEQAMDQVKALGGASSEVFVTLKNDKDEVDPNFQGIQGRLDVESKIAALQSRSESGDADPAQLLQDIKALQTRARMRVATITPERYPDLPPGVMKTEVGRSQGDLDRLEALAGPLREKVKNDRLAKLDPAERAARAKQTELGAELEMDVDDPMAQGGMIGFLGAAKTDPIMKQGIMFKRLATAKAGAEKERATVRGAQKAHTGAGWKMTSRRPRDRIADSSDVYARDYVNADNTTATGHMQFENGCTQEAIAHAMPESDDASINASITIINTAITWFDQAKASFSDAIQNYGSISAANPDEGIGG
ncbi:MAG: hypothetical protein AB7L94_34495, partial [Kofleriaceae bacterium]